jgi:hypothetical protein
MKLSKHCEGCKCSTCRWQGTDNCLQDRTPPCSSCHKGSLKDTTQIKSCEGHEYSKQKARE